MSEMRLYSKLGLLLDDNCPRSEAYFARYEDVQTALAAREAEVADLSEYVRRLIEAAHVADESLAALKAENVALRELLAEWWEDNPPDICSCDSDKECDGTCWCQRVRQVLNRDEIDAAVARAGGRGADAEAES